MLEERFEKMAAITQQTKYWVKEERVQNEASIDKRWSTDDGNVVGTRKKTKRRKSRSDKEKYEDKMNAIKKGRQIMITAGVVSNWTSRKMDRKRGKKENKSDKQQWDKLRVDWYIKMAATWRLRSQIMNVEKKDDMRKEEGGSK